jgi:hypothetical protein
LKRSLQERSKGLSRVQVVTEAVGWEELSLKTMWGKQRRDLKANLFRNTYV